MNSLTIALKLHTFFWKHYWMKFQLQIRNSDNYIFLKLMILTKIDNCFIQSFVTCDGSTCDLWTSLYPVFCCSSDGSTCDLWTSLYPVFCCYIVMAALVTCGHRLRDRWSDEETAGVTSDPLQCIRHRDIKISFAICHFKRGFSSSRPEIRLLAQTMLIQTWIN